MNFQFLSLKFLSKATEGNGCYGNGVGRLEALTSDTKVWLDTQPIQPGTT